MTKKIVLTAILAITLGATAAHAEVNNDLFAMKEFNVYGGYLHHGKYINRLIGFEIVPKTQPFESVDLLFNGEYHDSSQDVKVAKTYKGKAYNFTQDNTWINWGIKARKTFDNGVYLKGGVGVAYIENRAYGRHLTGSHWQFSPSFSLGYNITPKVYIESQYVHFSNARTSLPNPGRDFLYITMGYKF